MRRILVLFGLLFVAVFVWQLTATAVGPMIDTVVDVSSNSSAVQDQGMQDIPGQAAMVGLVWAPLLLIVGLVVALFATILFREGGGGYA